jgi:DNA polymerase-3 subunit epsilon
MTASASILPTLIRLDRPLVVFDLETTGLAIGEDKMVEIAYRKIMPNGEVVAVAKKINPGRPIPEDASALHGIYDKDVADAPSFAQLCYELWSVFEGSDVGGFNITGFDLPFLRAEFATVGKTFDFSSKKVLDAKVLYHSVTRRDMVSSRNLSAAYKAYCGKEHTTAHTGAGDVEVTVEVMEKLLEKHPEFRSWAFLMELHGQKKLLESAAANDVSSTQKKPANTLF